MIEINRILCPIDFSEYSDHALEYAVRMGARLRASVHVLHVVPPPTTSALSETSRRLALKNLSEAVDRRRQPNVTIEQELIESAAPAARIIQRAEALGAELIVTGSHGRTGVSRVLLGSVVESLLHQSRIPVLVIPSHLAAERMAHPAEFTRIICGVDFAAASMAALDYAWAIADRSDARLTLLNVIEMPPELQHPPAGPDYDVDRVRAEAEATQLTKLRAVVPPDVRHHRIVRTAVMEGGASCQLLLAADSGDADLIVLGVHGRNRLDLAIFGSNSKDIVTRARCPVLVVPAERRRLLWRAAS
jgi:nucleotide-binding universal stress UspA family protein